MRAVLLSTLLVLAPLGVQAQPADEDLDVPAAPAPAPAPSGSDTEVVDPTPAATPTTPPATAPSPAAAAPAEPRSAAEVRASTAPPAGTLASLTDAAGIEVGGFVQAQGQLDQQSQDQLMQGGAQLNRDGFVVRRARVSIARRWTYAALAVELDANTVDGASIGLRRAEAALVWPAADRDAPLGALKVGLTDIPFGRELLESSGRRLFMERSTSSLAFFPGEADVGASVAGAYRQFRYAFAVLAGEPTNGRGDLNRSDPNAAKDFVGRVGVEVAPTPSFVLAAGVSTVVGEGFHPGRDATKDQLQWRDLNENGAVELGELQTVPGSAAVPSENFPRWGLGADLALGVRTGIGWTRLAAEITVASNLDRGLFVADPITVGSDLRHLGLYALVTQDLGKHAFAGARFDYYDPNLDALDSRSGMLLPRNETITTISPLVGARFPHQVRAAVQYDVVLDNLARDGQGVPADLANNRITARLQVDL